MENKLPQLSNRSIVALLIIIPVACLLALIVTIIIIPTMSWPPDPPLIAATIVGPIIIVGFMIYGANLRDERTVQVSDKAARNGFMFILYVIPILLVVLSVTGASFETLMVLLIVCLGMIAVAGISAFYYYHR